MKSIIEQAVETLNKYRNQNYNSDNKDEVELANAINVILPNYVRQEKLLEIYKGAYDNASAELLKMFNEEQDYKDTLLNITRHLDVLNIYKQLKELENNENI